MNRYDAIVLGLGAIGTAALMHIARRGTKALGIEQFGVPHDRGSSHGTTRIIRKAYFEHPDYVPLLHRTYDLWADLESRSGKQLVHRTGLLLLGRPDRNVIRYVKQATTIHGLNIQQWNTREVRARLPGLAPDDDMEALFEADAGYLTAEECVRTHLEQARAAGAEVALHAPVVRWSVENGEAAVRTARHEYRAEALVICAGSWTGAVLEGLGLPLQIRRKVIFWFDADPTLYHRDRGCPTFCFDTEDGFFYGFPIIDPDGMKVAEHSGGSAVQDPNHVDRTVRESDLRPVTRFIVKHLPGVTDRVTRQCVCMYTMTPDEQFILDRHPDHDNVFIAAGFSGHGFKFAPIMGSTLADLVTRGTTDEPVGFLSIQRPALKE